MPGPLDAADARKAVAAMMDQRVDQRAGPVAGAGMDDEPGRLVDDDELVVLVEDVERDRLALRLAGPPAPAWRARPYRPRRPCGLVSAARLPPTLTAPCLISACTRLRETSPPRAAASHWSSRSPAASAATSALSIRRALRYQGRSSISDRKSTFGQPALDDEIEEKPLDPAVETRAEKTRSLRRDQSRPALRRPYGGGRGDCLQVAHGSAGPAPADWHPADGG